MVHFKCRNGRVTVRFRIAARATDHHLAPTAVERTARRVTPSHLSVRGRGTVAARNMKFRYRLSLSNRSSTHSKQRKLTICIAGGQDLG